MNLLIIDDDEICSYINIRVAQTCGLFDAIDSVHDGRAALDFFRRVCEGTAPAPDIILLDLNMPLINGFDFVRALQQLSFPNKENVRIVVLTSSQQPQDIEGVRALGIEHYITKPLTVNELQTTIFSIRKEWGKGPGASRVQLLPSDEGRWPTAEG